MTTQWRTTLGLLLAATAAQAQQPPLPAPGKGFNVSLLPTKGGAILAPQEFKCVPEMPCEILTKGRVELRAAAKARYRFSGWVGACEGSKQSVCVIDRPAKVGATFVPDGKGFNVSLLPTKGGAILAPQEFKDKCVPEMACEIRVAGPVELRAAAREGYLFRNWVGACEATKEPVCFVDRPVKVGASFVRGTPPAPGQGFPVSLLPTENGTIFAESKGKCIPEKACEIKGPVELRAGPRPGYQFNGWIGACDGKKEPVCMVDRPAKVGASFIPTGKPAGK